MGTSSGRQAGYGLPLGLTFGGVLLAGVTYATVGRGDLGRLAVESGAALPLIISAGLVVSGLVMGARALWARRPVAADVAGRTAAVLLSLVAAAVAAIGFARLSTYVTYVSTWGRRGEALRIFISALGLFVGLAVVAVAIGSLWLAPAATAGRRGGT